MRVFNFKVHKNRIMVIDGVSKMHMSHFVHKGRPWEGTKEIGRVKHARPQLPRPSLIKDGRAYWALNEHDPHQKEHYDPRPLLTVMKHRSK